MSILNQVYKDDKSNKYRPHEFVAKFPPEIRGMQPADISETLSALVHIGQISRSKTAKREQKRRGRKSKDSYDEAISGPKSYYEPSKLVTDVMRVFTCPSSRRLVFWVLIDCGLLWNYLYGIVLLELFRTKYQAEKKKRFQHTENKTEVDNFIEQLRNTDDRAIEKEADEIARALINLITDDHDLMLYLYVEGALNFY